MPDPRIRRPKHGATHGRRPGAGAPEKLAAAEAASAEAEAEAEAAASVAEAAIDAEPVAEAVMASAEAEAAASVAEAAIDAEPVAEAEAVPGAAPDAAPEAITPAAAETAAAGDAAGWFRETPLDESAPPSEDLSPPEPDLEPGPEPEPGLETIVRERDRPIVTSLPGPVPPVAPQRGRRLRGLLLGAATIVAVAAVGFVAGLLLPTFVPGPGIAVGSPSPGTSASASPTLSEPPSAEPSVAPSATPTPKPTPRPTPAPTQVVYVVKSGDQLARIAAKYGVTVAAIQEANGIKDPNLIRVGQKLIIPLPQVTPAP
jgi:LysM repeat protein